MKFLIFNVTVAAALVYLLTTDRTDVQNTAGRIHDAATEMKQVAGRVVDRGRSLVSRAPAETTVGAPSRAETPVRRIAEPTPIPMPPEMPDRQVRGETTPLDSRNGDSVAPRAVTAAPRPVPAYAAPSANTAPVTSAKEAAALKRREEILRGIDPAVLTSGSKTEAETALRTLSPAERRKRLYALSEEMELFYARTLGQ